MFPDFPRPRRLHESYQELLISNYKLAFHLYSPFDLRAGFLNN